MTAASLETWAQRVLAGERRALAQAISSVERGDPAGFELLKRLFAQARQAPVIGVTGSPGVGKSTLVEKLAKEYRRVGRRVGIIAVDPSSPFSGGALLGDRVRMQGLATDDGVYIRSMATRGHLGGLAPAAHDVATLLAASGCDVVLMETVGVGQDEVEVARLADATVLLVVPGMGDDVQAFKAGVMEIGDVFVINKSDRPEAHRLEQELAALLALAPPGGWRPPVIKTIATTGGGVPELRQALEDFAAFGERSGLARERKRERCRRRLLARLRQRLWERVVAERLPEAAVEELVEDILAGRRDPYSAVEQIVEKSGGAA